MSECRRNCWIIGGALGFVTLLLTWGGAGFFGAVLLGLLVALGVAALLIWGFCSGHPAEGVQSEEISIAGTASALAQDAMQRASDAVQNLRGSDDAAQDDAVQGDLGGDAPAGAPASGKADPAPTPAPVAAPAAPQADAPKAAPKAASQAGAAVDDLKRIKGVGPKLEAALKDLGVHDLAQIAAWDEAEKTRISTALAGRLRGADLSDWVAQAGILASGGETEFSARVDKGKVYS